jgi:hypothetical protein
MCGIAGAIDFKPGTTDRLVLDRMVKALRHRGPDDGGIWFSEGVGLGARRLAIIDLSPRARQPITNEDGSLWLVFNGEIYNFRELRTAFILDWVLLTGLVLSSRASFRLFAELLRPQPASFVRVLIYGAGHGGELVAREILNNPGHERVPVGFIDDDRAKHQTRIHGCPVLGGIDQLEALLRERRVEEVIVSSERIAPEGLARAREICQQQNVALRRLSFRLE